MKNEEMKESISPDDRRIVDTLIYLFDDRQWTYVKPALANVSGRTEFTEDEDANMQGWLRDFCPEWKVKDMTDDALRKDGRSRTRLSVPARWRRVAAENAETILLSRVSIGLAHRFVCAAARLYGAVGKDDIADLVVRWWDDAAWFQKPLEKDTPEARREAAAEAAENVLMIVDVRSRSPFAVAYVKDGYAISFDKYPPPESPDAPMDAALAEMLELRRGKKRYDPETLDDFLDFAENGCREWPDAYDRLRRFMVREWNLDTKDADDLLDCENALELVHDALAAGRGWHGAVNGIRDWFNTEGMPPKTFTEFARLLCDCANATRQDANWGFSPEEMVEKHGLSGTFDLKAVSAGFAADPCAPVFRATVKIGRNDPCPCGSGKKHKKCCGR